MSRAMKDSGVAWIGEIPAEWEVRKVKHYYQLQTGFTPDTKKEEYYDDEDGYDWVTISDIVDGATITTTKKKISQLYIDLFSPEKIPAGSLLYSFKLSVGQTAFAGKPLYSNEAIASFVQTEKSNLRFLRYSSFLIVENAEINIYNARILNQDRINNAFIVFPPLPEQSRIAAFLDRHCAEIDHVIAATQHTIEEYKKLKQSIITEAVTHGVRGERKMKDSGVEWIGEIPEEWEISRVGLHYNIILGKMLCSEPSTGEYTLERYFCAANVHFDGISDIDQLKEMWFSPAEKQLYQVLNGDLLVVEGGAGAGGSAIVTNLVGNAFVQNSIMIVRSKVNGDNRYLRYLIEYLVKQGYIDVVCNKATIPHFTKDKLATVPYPVLPIDEQIEIADYLDHRCAEIDRLIEAKQQLLTQLEAYKKSVIYEYVTGKREVV